ncbi:M13 family peptidase [Massilia sp. TS11]|nr:M13-type metalloendopeptidase [Massilia sp. TS11]MCG2585783.1 M13 family peptidase [Massilia sp. TS11]
MCILTLSLLTAFAQAADTAPVVSGIEKRFMEPSIRPQDDFYMYTNGQWQKTVEIPADQSRWGSFNVLRDEITPKLRGLIEQAQADKSKKHGSEAQKLADWYASYMDEAKREALGVKPLLGELSRIEHLKDKKGLPAQFAHLSRIGVGGPYGIGVSQDARNATQYAAYMGQSGLGLPDRDYYLKTDDAKMNDIRAKYEAHIAKTLALANIKDAEAKAKAVVALETELAKVQWTRVENRDPVKRYNKTEIAKLAEMAPGYDWSAALAAAGIASKTDTVIVSQPSYLKGFAEIVNKTDLDSWKAYMSWHLLRSYSDVLSKPFVQANFAFYGTTLTGVTEQRPLWKRGVSSVESALGEALGKQYVKAYFPPEYKAKMEVLVKNLLAAYKESIDTLDWMSPETKQAAQAKLAKFTPKIGYPNKWKDFSKLEVKAGDAVGNAMRAAEWARNENVAKLGKPIDKEEWGMTPQTINAYYRPTANEIVFPAAILQPPFFDAKADDAVNYGGIGAVIGHEISHGFDDSGAQYDGDGNLRDWWTPADKANFKAKTDQLVAQYNAFSPVPGYNVNGRLTLGENIADNSGLAIAYKAYKLSLGGKPAPVIDGMTGEQRLYLGWGQVWRNKARADEAIRLIKTDPHSPGEFRANGTLRNQAGFYEAFGVKDGDKMYLDPKERVTIW